MERNLPVKGYSEVKSQLAVILVNWRNARDTIECLETLLRSSIPVHAIVCDNGSGDGSVEQILAWAHGEAPPATLRQPLLRHLVASHALPHPIDTEHLGPGPLRKGGPRAALTLIETGANLGYAGGNNVGLRFALAGRHVSHAWLLNNDTVVEPHAAKRILDCFAARPALGLIGTDLRLYDDPDRFQMQGGMRFDRWTGRAFGIGAGRHVSRPVAALEVERQSDFVCGASMATSRAWLEQVGLLEERYFLYYEEIDWAMRNNGRFEIGYCPDAVVWHKEGASAGSSSGGAARSAFSDYHLARSLHIFGSIHYPALRPLYMARTLGVAARRLARGRHDKAAALARGALGLPFSPPASGR